MGDKSQKDKDKNRKQKVARDTNKKQRLKEKIEHAQETNIQKK